jgi:predicted RNA-binding Zn-ribbon protein involved in translation (DUF1610 family)
MSEHICPVCGYPDLREPAYDDNGEESFDICSSCGFQFGYDDGGVGIEDPICAEKQKAWREKWIAGGMKFKHLSSKPLNWDPVRQLLNIGIILKK